MEAGDTREASLRNLFPAHQRQDARREDHLGLLQPDTRDRVLEPPDEDRPQPASDIPPEGRPLGRPPLPRTALILDSERHTAPDEEGKRETEEGRPQPKGRIPDTVLDGDSPHHEHPEGSDKRGHQRYGRKGGNENMQHANGTGG